MIIELILFLVLFLIIAGQSCVLLLLLLRTKQRIRNITDEIQLLKNGINALECEAYFLKDKTQDLTTEAAKLRQQLNESDGKSEEDRKSLKMLMISDLHNDIDALDKKGGLDEKLRTLLGQVKENISGTEYIQKKSSQ